MKLLLVPVLLLSFTGYSQDTLKIKSIDALVNIINRSHLKVHIDTLTQDDPNLGLSSRILVTTFRHESEVKKYINNTVATMKQNGTIRHIETSLVFYYDHQAPIKIEETLYGQRMAWYYSNDELIYYTPQSYDVKYMGTQILPTAKSILETLAH